ncbi:calphotin-like, partial [Cydia splendana]|uniref:calphotin-like n=1 Tax=Cydia splendana TaxID=1100963 RepID=UPI00300D1887
MTLLFAATMKFLLIVASVVAVAVAGPTRVLVTPGGGSAPIVEAESPISVGPALIESPISVGPALVEFPIVESPVVVDTPIVGESPVFAELPIVVESPVVVDTPIVGESPVFVELPIVVESPVVVDTPIVGESPVFAELPIVVDAPIVDASPAAVAPVEAESVSSAAAPLVQIILNINQAAA